VRTRVTVALDLVNELVASGAPVRLFGGTAFRLGAYWDRTYGVPRPIRDIDLVTSRDNLERVHQRMYQLGGSVDGSSLSITDGRLMRASYQELKVDVYSDPLYLNHRIELGSRLGLERHTLSRADLLATKLQIEERTERDIRDVIALLATSSFSTDTDEGTINISRIVQLCSDSWGFYYSSVRFLSAAHQALDDLAVSDEVRSSAHGSIMLVLSAVDGSPKTVRWKIRSRIGSRFKWYEVVDSANRF
jgi:hypothetical protein